MLRPIPWLGAMLALAACPGGDDTKADGGSDDGIPPPPATGTETEGSTLDDTGDTLGTGSATTGGQCPTALVCGDTCCAADEVCNDDGQCVLDCGIEPPCGDVCCGNGEICYVGQCVVPGGACNAAVCATTVTSDCEDGQICDPQLGLCVPNFADPSCAFEPDIGVFDPVPRFTWGVRQQRSCDLGCQKEELCNGGFCEPTWNHVTIADDDFPTHYQCVMSPMVADLDADCTPEIIFNSYTGSNYTTNGILRAISGSDGSKVWTLTDDGYRTDPGSHPAIGDITGDGMPEVIVPSESNTLIAVAGATGTPLWISQPYSGGGKSGSPSIADFDNTGLPEIAFGRNIYDASGNIAWNIASGATGANGSVGPLSCVADLTGDGRPELIAGGTVYTFTGTVGVDFMGMLLWTGQSADGYCGVADLDNDGQPEVIDVISNNIRVYDGLTGATLATLPIAGGGAGGPPNIADFDGDGFPDIGTAGGDRYVVAQYTAGMGLTELWQADTKDGSSQRTGSSVFDFDGDGRSEVIYGDEWYLRIYPGTEPDCAVGGPLCDGIMTDEEILFIDINSSRTRSEYPIIADVDGDFKAEIVISTNNESGQGAIGDAGVEVFEDRLDNWVGTRPIWNQHTYHVTNVGIDGSIPAVEPPNWATYNSYRRNGQGDLEQLCAPDLVAADLNIPAVPCPDLEISVKVLNQGCLGVGPGVNVSFYDSDQGLLATVQTQGPIPAGGSETIQLSLPNPGNAPFEITVVVDDSGAGAGAFNECIEDNNETGPLEICQPIG
ncbi:FG-GAP-like repeat-containing protein [Paraliomyxa miuraensis]|uniref:FG-GAP-like repeat-containing protein n=1 Tax=Paraliomyxa miuraensis TaxID=376150 RepID=UPI00224DCF22|nr:FG-GAP-like repeat-containing protein [Paraliomyxa miuraensis]MCX4245108.1 FG-GAP-like repeat-containing protein [Paraliomyxa miuraensis]